MNLTWQHIPGFQKTNYRPYFTVGDPFSCLKQVQHTETNINITRISRNGVCGFSIDRGSHCTCAKGQSRGCARDMRWRYLLSEKPSYINCVNLSTRYEADGITLNPCLQVVTTCFSCSPPEVHSSVWTTTRLLYTCYKPLPPGSNPIAVE